MVASIFGLITFIIGALAGFAFYHFFFRYSNQERKLLDELHHAKHEFKDYHQKVAQSLTESASLAGQLQEVSSKLHEHILNATVVLNRSQHKQSILQPVLHADPIQDEQEEEQVTEFHPAQTRTKSTITPPRDYV